MNDAVARDVIDAAKLARFGALEAALEACARVDGEEAEVEFLELCDGLRLDEGWIRDQLNGARARREAALEQKGIKPSDPAEVIEPVADTAETAGPEAKESMAALRARINAATLRAAYSKKAAPEPEEEPAAEPEPEPEPEAAAARVQLPAVIPPGPPAKPEPELDALNGLHAIIDNYGGKTVIACWDPDPLDPSKTKVSFQTKDSFLLRYSNRFVPIETPDGRGGYHMRAMPMGQWWLAHQFRRQHRGVTFQPEGPRPEVGGCLNIWEGWGVEPMPGKWELIRDHIEKVIAGGNEEHGDYVIRWIAWSIQNPDKQAEVALVLIGEKGSGKGTLARVLQRIFGAHAFQVTDREHVIGKHNAHLHDCIFFIADEAYWGGDIRCVGRLQGMITEPTLPIEPKNVNMFTVRNMLHILMLAEPGYVIPAGRYERRYAALTVSDDRRGDRDYFKALRQQIDGDGASAMLAELQQMALDGWHPREIPESILKGAALQKQQAHNLRPLEQWYLTLLDDGELPGALPKRPNTALTRDLVDDAKERFPRLKHTSDREICAFLDDVGRLGVVGQQYRTATANGREFPTLPECREAFDRLYPGQKQWDLTEDWRVPETRPAIWPAILDKSPRRVGG
jgi:hypothetical protein